MDYRKTRIDIGPLKQQKVTQTCRAVDTKSVSMEIGRPLMHFVKGTKNEIEAETGVQIIFPWSKTENSILIQGNSAESITNASEKIKSVVDKAYNSRELGFSHFVSLPLAIHPQLVDKLVDFQNKILEIAALDEDKKGIEKSIFFKPTAVHLTILMLKLWNKERVKAAAEVLQSVSSKVMDALENKPVSIRLKGLDIMKGSLAKARVVYVPVEEIGDEGRLLRACQVIIAAFAEAGLVSENDMKQNLKLHASVMNALHRKGKEGNKKLELFDARGVFDLYGSEEWGEYLIREAHLSQRFLYDENGYYHCCASIPFPDVD